MQFLHINADVANVRGEALGVGEDELLGSDVLECLWVFTLKQMCIGEGGLKGVLWIFSTKVVDASRDVEAVGEDFYHLTDVGDAAVFAGGETEGRLCA